ncbi:unnamed protein product [Auanema sp. JU1783]|nr:unnamed protein product [Auanema sp. JU1783]
MILLYFVVSFILTINCQFLNDQTNSVYLTPNNCSSISYFDATQMSCVECGLHQVANIEKTKCVCEKGFQSTEVSKQGITCQPCPDGYHCEPCTESFCFCESHEIFEIIDDGLFQCKSCPNGTFPNSDQSICHACDDMSCTCSNEPEKCPTVYSSQKYSAIIQDQNRIMEKSSFLDENMGKAVLNCENGSKRGCQMVANFCVLQNFERQEGTACAALEQLQKTLSIWPYTNFPLYFPGDAESELNKEYIQQLYVMNEQHEQGRLDFALAIYDIEGNFVEMENPAESFHLCTDSLKSSDSIAFGRRYLKQCLVSYKNKLKQRSGYFYEPYIVYKSTDGTKLKYNIPILNRNLRSNGQQPNLNNNMDKWILTKRFYLLDDYTLLNYNSSTINLRYASDIVLHVPIRVSRDGHINNPYMEIIYQDVRSVDVNVMVRASFQVVYEIDPTRHDKDVEITMAVIAPISILWAALRGYSWGRRNGKQLLSDASTIVNFLLFSAAILSDVFLLLTAIIAIWITVSYKMQTYMFYVLINEGQETNIARYLITALVLKFVTLIHRHIVLSNQQTFFIDWEKPKIDQVANKLTPPSFDITRNSREQSVVVWRTYLVANEWNELQNYRKTSLSFQLICLMFCMEYLGWSNFALAESGFSTEASVPEVQSTFLTRYATLISVYGIILLFQWIIQVTIIERLILDPFHNFIDLCSISNISVLTLTDSLFGYYIHGRSVHGTADTGMADMNNFLQKERDNLCGNRGLEAGSDLQTFLVSLPPNFRKKYDEIMLSVNANQAAARINGVDVATAKMANTVRVHQQMTVFLQELVDHSLTDLDYVIRNRTFVEYLFDVDIGDTSQTGNLIRETSEIAFSRCFLYGNEWVNQSFEAALTCVLNLYFNNLKVSCAITFVLSNTIRTLFAWINTNNLVKTSLIDKRFLI